MPARRVRDMSALPPPADLQPSSRERAGPASTFDDGRWERSRGRHLHSARWIGWRLRALVVAALIGCLGMFLLIRALAAVAALPVAIHADDRGRLVFTEAGGAAQVVRGVVDGQGQTVALDALLLQRSARWLVDDAERTRHAQQHDALASALATGSVSLRLNDGQTLALAAQPHGGAGLGALFWLASTLALLLYLVTMVVLLVRPEIRNALYAVMALAQVGNLLFLGAESIPALGLPAGFMGWDHGLRSAFDLATAAALVHATGIHPRALPGHRVRALAVWLVVAIVAAAVLGRALDHAWWWTQAVTIGCGALAVAQLAWAQRSKPHPLLRPTRRC